MTTKPEHLGGDRWRIRAYVGTDPLTGRPRRRSISFRANGIRAAEKVARKVGQRLDDEREGLAASGSMAELVDDWLAISERDRSPSTMIAYRRHAERIKTRFGTTLAAELTASDIDRWYTALMAKGMTAANLRHVHRVLAAILRFGWRKGRLTSVETEKVTLPEYIAPDIKPPSNEQMLRVWNELPDVAWGRAVRLLALTGMRRGEVVGLRWEDYTGRTIKVRHSIVETKAGLRIKAPKGKRTRDVTLNEPARRVIESQPRVSEWIFTSDAGPARPGWVSLMWNRWRKGHGVEGVRVHDIRHWYATYAIERGAPVASVAAQLGHAQTSTTLNIYAAATDAGRQHAADAVGAAFLVEIPAPALPAE